MKTDLTKILSVGGYSGLFLYLAQSRGGVVVESLTDKKRTWFGPSAKMTSLSDISIFSQASDELRLQEVFEKMKEYAKEHPVPDAKTASSSEFQSFFEQVVPEYDRERFYASHMKKVVDWFNILYAANALDFVSPEEEQKDSEEVKEATHQVKEPSHTAKPAKSADAKHVMAKPAKVARPAGSKAQKTGTTKTTPK